MTEKVQLSRRSFVAANAAVAAAAAVPAVASASTAPVASKAVPTNWETVTGDQLAGFVGDRFRVRSSEAGELVMRLIAVEPVNSGADRPSHLPRSESVIAVFDSPDKAPLVACGQTIHRVSHPRLGSADLYFGPSCLRSGGHVLEMVLN